MSEQWREAKAHLDSLDDGSRPHMDKHWIEFKEWALDNLGQGYSLACEEGVILDPITRWTYRGFAAGREQRSAEP